MSDKRRRQIMIVLFCCLSIAFIVVLFTSLDIVTFVVVLPFVSIGLFIVYKLATPDTAP